MTNRDGRTRMLWGALLALSLCAVVGLLVFAFRGRTPGVAPLLLAVPFVLIARLAFRRL